MRIGKACVAVSFGLVSLCHPGLAQIVISPTQPGATNYLPSKEAACSGGYCTSSLPPAGVNVLGNSVTTLLAGDMSAQFGWTVIGGGQVAVKYNIFNYQAISGKTARGVGTGANLQVDYTSGTLPPKARWIQVVSDNDNGTGYTDFIPQGQTYGGKTCSTSGGCWGLTQGAKGPGVLEDLVDISPPTGTSPFYHTPGKIQFPSMEDGPFREGQPTEANPSIDWQAQLFLVSLTGPKTVTVYSGIGWGWDSTWSKTKSTFPRGAKVYNVNASGETEWGEMTVTGSVAQLGGTQYYSLQVDDGVYSYDFSNATGLDELSEIPEQACFLGVCTNSGPLDADLAFTADTADGFFSAGLEDSGEDFSATGTLTASGASSGLFETAAVAGVPEPSTWAMMLLGFAGLGFAGYRRAREPSAAI
jgi:PEP-CTERM motif